MAAFCGMRGVDNGTRTHDNRNHNPGLYQLSYIHRWVLLSSKLGAPDRNRTCNPQLRRLVLYPVELRALYRAACLLVGAAGFELATP